MFLEHKPSNLHQVSQLLSNIKVIPTQEKTTSHQAYINVMDTVTGEVECRKIVF
jgi:hypothetical protein